MNSLKINEEPLFFTDTIVKVDDDIDDLLYSVNGEIVQIGLQILGRKKNHNVLAPSFNKSLSKFCLSVDLQPVVDFLQEY